MKRSVERDPIPLRTRRVIWERSGRVCEACWAAAVTNIHHRKLRSQGGDNDPSNLLGLCTGCHNRVHANPEDSYRRGLLVRRSGIPAMTPIKTYCGERNPQTVPIESGHHD